MKYKSETYSIIKNFLQMVKNQFNTSVKVIRYDNGKEFTSNQIVKLFAENGILQQFSCPYTPQQNSKVEKKHKDLLNIARALKIQVGIPLKYWGLCILNATHIINRLSSVVLNNKTPFEVLNGEKADYNHLKIVGCLCFTNNTKRTHKFSPKALECVFIGYAPGVKGNLFLDMKNNNLIISRDVIS